MKIIIINGSPKKDGFITGTLDIISSHLEIKDITVQQLSLATARIDNCIGCFRCLKTGSCVLMDDMQSIVKGMLEADGFVVGSPVRNGLTTACYKRFYERISFWLGFPLLLEDKHTLAISSVGFTGGKAVNKRLLGLQDVCHTRLSDFIFCRVGMQGKVHPDDFKNRLIGASNRLILDIERNRKRSFMDQVSFKIDRVIMRRFLFKIHPEIYSFVIESWKHKGYM